VLGGGRNERRGWSEGELSFFRDGVGGRRNQSKDSVLLGSFRGGREGSGLEGGVELRCGGGGEGVP